MTGRSGIVTDYSGTSRKSVTINRNHRSACPGIAGHDRPESPVNIARNTHEAAVSHYELSVALSGDAIGDPATVCNLQARAVRSAFVADLLYQGTSSLALTGNNLVRLCRQSAAQRSKNVETHSEWEAALLSRVLVVTSFDAGQDWVPRELFTELDIRICTSACENLLDLITQRLFGLTVADLIVRNRELRENAFHEPPAWARLLPLSGGSE